MRDPLTRKRLSKVPALDRVGYIAENGLDREDAALLKRDPDAFNRMVGRTITKNLHRTAQYQKAKKAKKTEPVKRENTRDRLVRALEK